MEKQVRVKKFKGIWVNGKSRRVAPPKKREKGIRLPRPCFANIPKSEMEADITPAAETNGSTEISSQQHENREEGLANKEPPLEQNQQQEPVKSGDSVEAGVAGAVGEIIDYLEVR